jgi:CheY-like chemotaxis protein
MTPPIDASFEPGVKSALACVDDPAMVRVAVEQLTEIGYRVSTGISAEDLLYKMQANTYDVVLIAENLGDAPLENNAILAEALQLSGRNRRQQVIILIGPSFQSGDEAQAFQFSVDQVINQNDLNNLRPLVRRAVARAEEFYGRFTQAIEAADRL